MPSVAFLDGCPLCKNMYPPGIALGFYSKLVFTFSFRTRLHEGNENQEKNNCFVFMARARNIAFFVSLWEGGSSTSSSEWFSRLVTWLSWCSPTGSGSLKCGNLGVCGVVLYRWHVWQEGIYIYMGEEGHQVGDGWFKTVTTQTGW